MVTIGQNAMARRPLSAQIRVDAKFVPGLGTVGPPLAGAAGVGVLRFSLYSASKASLWSGAATSRSLSNSVAPST
jgi:membrane protein DedA with SNARE-associated domain